MTKKKKNKLKEIVIYPHNENPLKQIVKLLEKKERQIILVLGTGVGKTFIAMKLVHEYFGNEKVLYIIPQESISYNIKTYPEFELVRDRIEFINMQQFKTFEKTKEILQKYKYVIMDEAHHLGSDIFGKNILEASMVLDNVLLGLTATPLRGDSVNIENEFKNVVYGLSVFDCIKLGLMPEFRYFIGAGDKNLVEYIERIEQMEDEEKGRTERNYEGCTGVIKDIVKKHPRKKWIVFSSTIEAMKNDKAIIESVFPGKKIFEIHSENEKNNEEIIQRFNDIEEGILMSVNMALEGFHINTCDGLIILRSVQTLITFEQMLGRACSIGKKQMPVVIDCSQAGVMLLEKIIEENNKRWDLGNDYIDYKGLILEINDIISADGNEISSEKKKSAKQIVDEIKNRDILHISFGASEEWEDVSQFMEAWANTSTRKTLRAIREERTLKAINFYLRNIDMWKKAKLPDSVMKKLTEKIITTHKVTKEEFYSKLKKL